MKRPILYLFLCIPAIVIQTEGCRKKDRTPQISNVEQHIKDWMFFDTGTWWVYKELNSGTIDSQYVTKSKMFYYETDPNDKKNPYNKTQSIEVYINSGFFFHLSSPMGGSNIEKIKFIGSEAGSTYLIFKPLEVGQRKASGGASGYIEIKQIDPHYTIDSLKYDTLVTLLDNRDNTEQNDSVEYKIFKGVGIINKKNITKKEEWQLIKYKINLNKQ